MALRHLCMEGRAHTGVIHGQTCSTFRRYSFNQYSARLWFQYMHRLTVNRRVCRGLFTIIPRQFISAALVRGLSITIPQSTPFYLTAK